MSKVRVLVGTKKGAFILSADGKREKWDVSGPFFGGWEIYHLKGSPIKPDRIYASQSSGWFGQVIQRSDDGGKTWDTPGGGIKMEPGQMPSGKSNMFVYDTSSPNGAELHTHQWYDGTQHPWEFKRVWHLEPSLTDADAVYAGVEDAALFLSTDGAKSWHEFAGMEPDRVGSQAQAECVCTRLFSTRRIQSGFTLRFRRRERFARTTVGKRGSRSIEDSFRNTFPIRMPKWGIAFIMWRCTNRGRTRYLCRSTGT